jgi:transcriptional regulator of acetoin/glycerol metabolism
LIKLRKDLGIKTLKEVKRDEIARAIVLANGDNVLAALLLGIGKTSLYRALKEIATDGKRRRVKD